MKENADDRYDEMISKPIRASWTENSLMKKLSSMKTRHGSSLKVAAFIVSFTLVCVLTTAVVAQLFQQSVTSYGTIKVVGVGLYSDSACTSTLTSIDWGIITPGTSIDRYVYVRNDGTAAGTLSMSYGNFTPTSAAAYIALTWNCSGYVLSRNTATYAKLTLNVQSNVTGVLDFNFVIFVQASA